ncbi:hypothetical protein PR048_006791 [Dryococelus australis]|uniref:Mutator-like transposase domain-containing protein n=1 Tax=Dryococelus australis TaxID=614101 RepID=A0ABQ9IC11_9NEOP|nr:hypothetical protein PR048_006791 [Dryococelus australis]
MCSVAMHGVKYHQMIGDGDSSAMCQLEKVEPYGSAFVIKKIERINHLSRYYLRWLQDISSKTKIHLEDVPLVLRKALSDRLQHLVFLSSLELSNTGKVKLE